MSEDLLVIVLVAACVVLVVVVVSAMRKFCFSKRIMEVTE
jgi:hypothetical protein